MNKARRSAIDGFVNTANSLNTRLDGSVNVPITVADLKSELEALKDDIEQEKSDEQDYYDSMPESLQNGDKGSLAIDAINNLEAAIVSIGEILDELDQFSSKLDTVIENLENAKSE